uniref:Ig-like domain-containing protein n=1 Tax=Cyprinus carpio TaxID=7962 RepID=A0A8C1IY21_CYPCA
MPKAFFSKVSLISVSLDVTVEGFIGGSVVLPCSSAEHDLKLQEVDVSWRHNGSKNVCDLIPRSNSIETQDPRYKNRTKTFPEGYERRNFSIRLTDLTHADAGKYICLITPSDEQKTKTKKKPDQTVWRNHGFGSWLSLY